MNKFIYIALILLVTETTLAADWGSLTVTSKSNAPVEVYCVSGKILPNFRDQSALLMGIEARSGASESLRNRFPNIESIGCNMVDKNSQVLLGNFEFNLSYAESNMSIVSARYITCTNYSPSNNTAPSIEVSINCTPTAL